MWQVTNERRNASPLLGFLPLFSSMAEDIGKHLSANLDLEFLVEFSRRHVRMAAIISQWETAGVLTVQRLASRDFVRWIDDGLTCETKNLNELGSTLRTLDFSQFSRVELAEEVSKVITALRRFIEYNNFVNTSDFYHHLLTTKVMTYLGAAETRDPAISPEFAYAALTTPDKTVWVQEEEKDFLQILRHVQHDPELLSTARANHAPASLQCVHADLRRALEEHAQKYFWLRYEQEGDTLTAAHFYSYLTRMLSDGVDAQVGLDCIRERRARSRNHFDTARSSLQLGIEADHWVTTARLLVYWKLHLREAKVRFYCCTDSLLTEAAIRLNLDRQQVRHLTVEELIDALRGTVRFDPAAINRRIKYCVFHFSRSGTRVLEGKEARDAFSVVAEESISGEVSEIKGTCAYPGIARGIVQQVLTVEDADQFRRRGVLVAYMTDVGVVPAMRKACAIVTDVGGVTCHASIIAREFGIPCVIGTKIATKILLDGYTVEVNATTSLVSIMSRACPAELTAPSDPDESTQDFGLKLSLPTARSALEPSPRVSSLSQLTSRDVSVAGGKGASLGALTRMSIPVPPGFVVLTSAFDDFIAGRKLAPRLNELLGGICDQRSLRLNSKSIQQLISETELPSDTASEIHGAFQDLNSSYVAVRSSAAVEDSTAASWAGQLESFLNVREQDLFLNVRRCWASLFSERAISYRQHCGAGPNSFEVAVVVQRMLESRVAGTAFSIHPVTGDSNSILIECCVGLGETLVLGRETPNTYLVRKNDLAISYKRPGSQRIGLRRAQCGGGNESFVLGDNPTDDMLSDDEAKQIAAAVIAIERAFGFPVDVEWASDGTVFYVLQSRPVTGITHRNSDRREIA